jgi:uncharacterized membrane protein YjgN (DUF898 family)
MTTDSDVTPLEPRQSVRFLGDGLSLFATLLVNGLLTICTLGIYHFWGKARLRRYLWQSTEVAGDRFEFHGTGAEMFIGWLKVVGIFLGSGLVLGAARFLFGPTSVATLLLTFMSYAGIMLVIPFALVGARRYMLSRTSWRGIRFSFRGEGVELLGPYLKGVVLSIITLGFYSPLFTSDLYAYFINKSTYGDRPFKYEGDGRALLKAYVRTFFLGFVTFGLAWAWYAAEQLRYLRSHTTFGGVRFHSTVTGGKLLWLAFTNILLVLLTLGIGIPWALARVYRFQSDNLVLRGTLDVTGVQPSNDRGSAVGEELASYLDVGSGL